MKLIKLPFLCLLLMLSHVGFSQILLESSQTSEPIDWAKPKEYTLAAIEVECSQYTDKNIVRLLSGLTPGDKIQIPGDKISEAIKNLWKQSLFEDVKVYLVKVIGNEAFLKISVTEKPRLYGFSFTGNVKKNDADDIRAKIRFVREKVVTDYTLELNDWATFGVEGHFLAKNPWLSYHEILTDKTAKIVGALPSEVVMMNQLTVNLHLLMVSFYTPTKQRYKILCEAKAFPSDQYALQSQVKFHGFDPAEALVEVGPREGEYEIRHEDIYKAIEAHKDSLALVMIGGVNYFSGQVFDMKAITEAGHKAGAVVGFDLAHAAGNLELELHNWNVDFAAWCSYKYLNAGPGSVAGAFVHEKHHTQTDLPLFAGWWGHDKATRFKMDKEFRPIESVERWQLSNAPILSMAAYKASLDIFDEVGMRKLNEKSKKLTAYLEFVVTEINRQKNNCLEIITPKANRGCQISIVAHGHGKALYTKLIENGVIPDWREPNVIRCAPVPMYNSFEDIYRFGEILMRLL